MKYRTKAVTEVEAMQFTGSNGAALKAWVEKHRDPDAIPGHWFLTKGMTTATSNQSWNYAKEGQKWSDKVRAAIYNALHDNWLPVADGDYIICGPSGDDFYTVNPDVFDAKYEKV